MNTRNTAASPLSIQYRSPAELQLNPKNPRLHSSKQIEQLSRSIENFGFTNPILISHGVWSWRVMEDLRLHEH